MESKNVILNDIRAWLKLDLQPQQKKYLTTLLNVATPVQCVPISEVFSPFEIELICRVVKPQPKECYKNAHILTLLFPTRVKYVEGKAYTGIIPIDHAFNKVGDKYVDITFEMVLNEDVTKYEYVKFGEYDIKTIEAVTNKTGYYGNIYEYRYNAKIVNKYRKSRK